MLNTGRTKRIATSVMALSIMASSTQAFTNGPPAGFNGGIAGGGTDCSSCHTDSFGGSGAVQIIGAPTGYAAGMTYNLTVRIEDPVQVGAGYQLSVEDSVGNLLGTLALTDDNSQLNTGFVNHTGAGVAASIANWSALGGAAEYGFTWQAPAADAGELTFWVVGNAINNAGGNSGDLIYLHSETAAFTDNIPTASEWGLVVMLLLLMTAGTLIIARRRTTVCCAPVRSR